MITIRSLEKSDLPGLGVLIAEFESELPTYHPRMDEEEIVAKVFFVAGNLDSLDSAYVVAEYDGRLAGYLFAHVRQYPAGKPREVVHVEELFVTEGMRGKGVGLLLIEEGVRRASERGLSRIEISSYYGKTDRRWKRLGFIPSSTIAYAETESAKKMIERARRIRR